MKRKRKKKVITAIIYILLKKETGDDGVLEFCVTILSMKTESYSLEEALNEAKQKTELVGKTGGTEDYEVAEELIEEEKWKNSEYLEERLKKERVSIALPETWSGHKAMICYRNPNRNQRLLFNWAAKEVTRDFDPFHQVGSRNEDDYTAWELWKPPEEKDWPEMVSKVEAKMRELAKEAEELGLFANGSKESE